MIMKRLMLLTIIIFSYVTTSYAQYFRCDDSRVHYYLRTGYSISDWKEKKHNAIIAIKEFGQNQFGVAFCSDLVSNRYNRELGLSSVEKDWVNRGGKKPYSKDYSLSTSKYVVFSYKANGGIWGPEKVCHYAISVDWKELVTWDNDSTGNRTYYQEITIDDMFPKANTDFLE